MKGLDWITGVKRLYLVVWACWLLYLVVAEIHDGIHLYSSTLLVIVGVIIPFGILKAFQWIYMGMQPKKQ